LLRFWKSTHKRISLFFFLTSTKLPTHFEYLNGTIILSSNICFNSFSIMVINMGLNCQIFCLNGLEPTFRGILWWMMLVSNIFKSSYDHGKVSTNFLMRLTYLSFCSTANTLENLMILGFSMVSIFQYVISSS
jgi:hypothetical protein